ncbi:MAG: protein translocase subunit SecD [Mucispirillum sp.]|nr:protein translocase subunit SecD [Mucispirillum sp.]
MGLTSRWVLIAIILGWSVYAVYPLSSSINLGLDLQGGMHIVLDVDTDKAIESKIDNAVSQIRKDLASEEAAAFVKKDGSFNVAVTLGEGTDRNKVLSVIEKNYPYLEQKGLGADERSVILGIRRQDENRWRNDAVDQSVEVLRNRIDEFGVAEPLLQRQGDKKIVVQLPGLEDPEAALELIGKTAVLTFHLVDESVTADDLDNDRIPYDDIKLYYKVIDRNTGRETGSYPMALKRDPVLTGSYLSDAEVMVSSQDNRPYVAIRFDPTGAKIFEEITRNNLQKNLAIVLDGTIYSAPTIQSVISGGDASINGNFSFKEANNLAIVLKAGSLPAPVSVAENRPVGASLGDDSIRSGVTASIIGFVLIVLFIGIYYRLSGMVANVALLLNLLLILAVLAQFRATLTLPGIAGIMLTLGMAVDANVLIFERVREELRKGRTVANAIDIGYTKAFTAIVDSNITSLIAAVVLFQFGTGPIKGFAITLSVGLIASMFTAIFVTRTIFMSFMYKRSIKKLSI